MHDLSKIYGLKSYPYFVYAPRWVDSSAGIKALHFLCHSLNSAGQKAYLVLTESQFQNQPRVNHNLLTPILTQEISDAFFRDKVSPIVIYSETVPGNPLSANCVVRYLMNFSGALGGPAVFDENEIIISFSKKIAEDYAIKNNTIEPKVLFLPPIDPREFVKVEDKEPFQLVYAGKYRSFVGKPPKVGNLTSIEIFRDGPRMQSREQVKDLLKKASILYSFENSSIVNEAILSGTPAKFVSNEFLGEVIAEVELGQGGIVKGDSEIDLNEAKLSIDQGIAQYYRKTQDYFEDLVDFISATQRRAAAEGIGAPITVPIHNQLVSKHRIGLAKQIAKNQGLKTLIRVTYHFSLRRLSWRYWMRRELI